MCPIAVPPPRAEAVDRRLTAYLTESEMQAVFRYAVANRLSMSAAARRLINKGLSGSG